MAIKRLPGTSAWNLRHIRRRRRSSATPAAEPPIPAIFLQSDAVRVEAIVEATSGRDERLRRAGPSDLAIEVDVAPGEACLLAIRHPSGALTFHRSSDRIPRARPQTALEAAQFRVPIRDGGRRGLVSKVLTVVVLKIAKAAVDRAVSVALPRLAALAEKRMWSRRRLEEGWFRVAPAGGSTPALRLTRGVPEAGQRSLLLLHGTVSSAGGAFDALAASDFFERVRPLYGSRIYAYNHFSISRTPDENAERLLRALPAGDHTFDAVTHSRGGLVLRSLVENRERHGALASRFALGHAVLVASPNDGTPLATPGRWDETIGWLANLIELFPENPLTMGAAFVSEALVWLASHLSGDLPGLRAMDAAGALVAALQAPPAPPPDAYSALVANFHPNEKVLARALDVGVDAFFAAANDLVVPSEGGWRIDRDGAPHIPAARIGCFGPGGNITATNGPVHHLNFFAEPGTTSFIATALAGLPQPLPPVALDRSLPDRRFTRVAAPGGALPEAEAQLERRAGPGAAPGVSREPQRREPAAADTFHIVIMDELDPAAKAQVRPRTPKVARIFAAYGGARVSEAMRLRSDKSEPKTLFGEIIRMHERIKTYTNFERGSLPSDEEMLAFGGQLFETLFRGSVRRLYDEARALQRGRTLDLVLTSMIPWIGEKPWEFAYDTGRRSFLATGEIHFVRNVLTSVPADAIPLREGPLRILVASAQPVGFNRLSVDEEGAVVGRGFEALVEDGLAEVDVLPRATPAMLHGYLSTGRYDIVHFIGHGVFDEVKGEGSLVFEDDRGGALALGERSIREIFCQRGLSLVFLNACQSGTGGRADFNKGVAQSLVAHGLPALVANQYSVLDSSATSFAQHFYWSLAQGLTLGQSAREARVAVNYSLHGELIDWAVPVLYARDANRALAARPAAPSRVPSTIVQGMSRRAAAARPVRVAVWDLGRVFPALRRTLDAMNAAQRMYGFELVDMSVPLDVWDLEEEEDGPPYLRAERLARRLRGKAVELGVDLVACLTRQWMRDEEWLNLYAWWPAHKTPPVAILSWAGFDDLPAAGPTTDRVIANSMAAALAGFFGDTGTHESGAKTCPLFFNQQRDWAHMTGAQTFDAQCRRLLAARIADHVPALDALLQAFK